MSSCALSRLVETRCYTSDMFIHWIFAEENKLSELCDLGNAGFSYNIPNPFECDKEKILLAHENGFKVCLRAADNIENLAQMKALDLDYYPTNKMHTLSEGKHRVGFANSAKTSEYQA